MLIRSGGAGSAIKNASAKALSTTTTTGVTVFINSRDGWPGVFCGSLMDTWQRRWLQRVGVAGAGNAPDERDPVALFPPIA
jgi:hypothetical protein